ncbi:hypothetical protein CXB51_010865 [Gossypium anomalum]|uniref:Retrotransposon gag protein n=1 Tax=Gossypium anomalum TaxID=47600 RepID=A0A8J5ZNW5_9ROSI|nr:hypothetical protein CXB51_010865 [Gossypium anomalum]
MDLETLYDAWERYKDLLRRCPHYGLPLWLQVQTFYNGVNPSTRQIIDAAAGGTINNKTLEEAYEFIEEMPLNNYQWQVMRTKPTKTVGVYNVDSVNMLSNQVELLNKKIDGLLGSTHERNHPNFSWGGQGNQRPQNPLGFQQPLYQQEKKPNLEEMLTKFISVSKTRFQNTKTALKNQQMSIQRLKTHICQLSKLISERLQGSLPSNTEPNPREQLNAINVRNEEGLVEPKLELRQEIVASKHEVDHSKQKLVSEEYKPRVPYPNATRKDRTDEQFGKFLKLLKKLHINLPFIEALSQMPNIIKFLNELLVNKRKLDEASHVELNAVCSAILQNKLQNKLKDPGSFTIPYLIGSLNVKNALADLGASINVMPYKIFKQLGLGKRKQTRMSIQLADKTIRFPRGIIEDILVKIDKFIFPIDFVILDIEEDSEVPLILGRPFLAAARTIIDVGTGELTLRVNDETITLQARNSSNEGGSINNATDIDHVVQPSLQETRSKSINEPCLHSNKGPIYEERRLQIEELDEWRTQKPRTHDKPKP